MKQSGIEDLFWEVTDPIDETFMEIWDSQDKQRIRAIRMREWLYFLERHLYRTHDTTYMAMLPEVRRSICTDRRQATYGAFNSYLFQDHFDGVNALHTSIRMLPLLRLYRRHEGILAEETKALIREIIDLTMISIVRNYSLGQGIIGYNGCFDATVCLVVGGAILKQSAALETGLRRLSDYLDYAAYFGSLWEYNTPSYLRRDLCALATIEKFTGIDEAAHMARLGKERLLLDVANHYHPGLQQLGGPYFRSYYSDVETRFVSIAAWLSYLFDEPLFHTAKRDTIKTIELAEFPHPLLSDFDAPPCIVALLRHNPQTPSCSKTMTHYGIKSTVTGWTEPAYPTLMHLRDLPGEIIMYSGIYAPASSVEPVRDITCYRDRRVILGSASLITPHHTGRAHHPLHEKPMLLHYMPTDRNDMQESPVKTVHVTHRCFPVAGSAQVTDYHHGGTFTGSVRGAVLQDKLFLLAGMQLENFDTDTVGVMAGWTHWDGSEIVYINDAKAPAGDFSFHDGDWVVVEDGDFYICLCFTVDGPDGAFVGRWVPWHIHGPIDYGADAVFECGFECTDATDATVLRAACCLTVVAKAEVKSIATLYERLAQDRPRLQVLAEDKMLVNAGTSPARELTVEYGPQKPPPMKVARVRAERLVNNERVQPEKMVEAPFVCSGKRPVALKDCSLTGDVSPMTLFATPDNTVVGIYQPLSYAVPVTWGIGRKTITLKQMPRGKLIYDKAQNTLSTDFNEDDVEIAFAGFPEPPRVRSRRAQDFQSPECP